MQLRNLHIFSFTQHWFHLGSAIENTIEHKHEFEKINGYLFQQHLRCLPIDMHFRFPGSSHFKKSRENIMPHHLKSEIGAKFSSYSPKMKVQPPLSVSLPQDIHSLKRMKIDDMEIGMAIASHLISLTNDSQPNLSSYYELMRTCIQFFTDVSAWFHEQSFKSGIDEIWICNGRTFHEKVISELARRSDLSIKYYEIGGEGLIPNRWILHESSPHNRALHQSEIENHFLKTTHSLPAITKWFLSHENPSVNKFASIQGINENNDDFNTKPFLVFFSSSDDEVAAVSSEWDSPWGTQLECVRSLISKFNKQDKYNLIIRVHPNQGNKSKHDRRRWNSLVGGKNVQIYRYSDAVNSYELLRKSEAVLTHGSTLGVEAAFRKKPQAYLAPCRYDLLVPAPLLDSDEAVTEWISSLASDKSEENERRFRGSLKWAHYMLTAGMSWRNVKIKQVGGSSYGFVSNRSLRPKAIWIILTRLFTQVHLTVFERRLESVKTYLKG
jgi:hypothetical protein